MAILPQLWTQNALAIELGRDIRTVARALKHIPPDGKIGKRDGWRMTSAVVALARHEAASDQLARRRSNGDGSNDSLDQLVGTAERVEEMLVRLRREPDLERRRKILQEHGSKVGALDRALKTDCERRGPEAEIVLAPVRDRMLSAVIGEVLALTDMEIAGSKTQ
jgi:hypothetical protein